MWATFGIVIGFQVLVVCWLVRVESLLFGILKQQHNLIEKENLLMATLSQVQAAIAQLKTELAAAIVKELGEIAAQIQALKDQIAAGSAATPSQLDALLADITEARTTLTGQVDAISTQDGSTPTPQP